MPTWTGQDFSFDWGAPNKWDSGSPPQEDDLVVIPGGQTFDAPVVPAGTKVKALNLQGGGLQGLLEVTEDIQWTGGYVAFGLRTGPFGRMTLSGSAKKSGGGRIEAPFELHLLQARDLELSDGAELVSPLLMTSVDGT
jgi:hypothetical protein